MCLCSCGSRLPRAGTVCQRVSLIIGLVRLNGPVSGHVPDDNVDTSAACLKPAITQNLDGRSCVSHATRWCLQVDDLTDPDHLFVRGQGRYFFKLDPVWRARGRTDVGFPVWRFARPRIASAC